MNILTTLIYSDRPAIRMLRHVLFWVVDIANYLIVYSLNGEVTRTAVLYILLTIPLVMVVTYFILYWLIPKFSQPEYKGTVFLAIFGIILFLGVGMRYWRMHVVGPIIDPDTPIVGTVLDFKRNVREILSAAVVISQAIAIKLIKSKTELQEKNIMLLEEKKVAELNFLKSQMHPHFLFNTLNTLYSETIQESGKAQEVVLHLSSLLRFILDECNQVLIPIGREIRVIKDFVALEQLRHGARLNVDLAVTGIDHNMYISPLIFLPFVENSFKHTLANKRGPIQIDITLTMKGDNFCLVIENDHEQSVRQVNGHHKTGKGIANAKRQLELLYGKNYSLMVDDANQKYRVSLLIPASQHPV